MKGVFSFKETPSPASKPLGYPAKNTEKTNAAREESVQSSSISFKVNLSTLMGRS